MEHPKEFANANTLSDKDTLLLKKTFRTVSELYYESSNQQTLKDLSALLNLIRQVISTKKESDSLSLVSQLETLKVKSKTNQSLVADIDKTINHLKSPHKQKLNYQTLLYSVGKSELYVLSCTIMLRFYDIISAQGKEFDWKAIIGQMSHNCQINPTLTVELLSLVCAGSQLHSKVTSKSGLVKFIFSSHIPSLSDRYHLYKSLKLLKIIAQSEHSILKEREKTLAAVIYTYEQYVTVVQEICGYCYEKEYCLQVESKKRSSGIPLDSIYLWSYCENFWDVATEKTIFQVRKWLEGTLSAEQQTKIYAILANYTRHRRVPLKPLPLQAPKHPSSLLNYIKLCLSTSSLDPKFAAQIDFATLNKLMEKNTNGKVAELLKELKQSVHVEKKIGRLGKGIFDISSNVDQWMQRAGRIPTNNEELEDIKEILHQNQKGTQFQIDTLQSIKQKALSSLNTAIIQKKQFDLSGIINNLSLNSIPLVAKFLQMLELYLMMNPTEVDKIPIGRIHQILTWLQENYNGEIIDWGSIGQLLIILEGQTEWTKHISQIPKKCYWILGAGEVSKAQEKEIFNKLSSIKQKSSLALGFLGKILSKETKVQIMKKYPQLFKNIEEQIKQNINFKTNLLMMSYWIKNWSADQSELNKQFLPVLQSLLNFVLSNFRATEHEYAFLQACLPYKFKIDANLSQNIDFLVGQYGRLASYVYQNAGQGKKNLSYQKISSLPKIPFDKSETIMQMIDFLQDNCEIIQSDELKQLLDALISKKNVYWLFYPNYVSLLSALIQIIGKTTNQNITQDIPTMVVNLLNHIIQNPDLSEEERADLYKYFMDCLDQLSKKGTYIDIQKIKRIIIKIKQVETKEQIFQILNNYKIFQKKEEPVKEIIKKQVPISIQIPNQKNTSLISDRNYRTNIVGEPINQKNAGGQELLDQKEELQKDHHQQIEDQINLLDKDGSKINMNGEMTVLQALRMLKKIIDKQADISQFPKLHAVFMKNEIQTNHKDILGHLLAKFYPLKQCPTVIDLLLMKSKTNLSKEACYQLLKNYKQPFVLATRWKLSGKQWVDLAMQRFQEGFFADGCQVAEYNLLKVSDIQYFNSKKYPNIIAANVQKAIKIEDMVYYLLLVGTSARLADVKTLYINQKIHVKILQFLNKNSDTLKIIANSAYALSSMVYMQPEICLQIVRQKESLLKLIQGFKQFYSSKPVIESGACLIANLAYSNEEVKELLRQYGIIQTLIYIFEANLSNPEISTYKQLLRAFGNLSLSLKCSEQIINQHFCALAVQMVEKLDIFVHFEDKKAKLMKILIDLIANLSAHKYKLQVIHHDKITLLILTLLETTESNPPILTGCIDTIDGLCQNQEIESYCVTQKKLPYILIDILKIQQDEKIIVKSTRLLTNLTINPSCIPYILEANLLSVLANIVMPNFCGNKLAAEQSKKMETYVFKIITRIYHSKQPIILILKSGYLDCLVRTIETTENLEDSYIDILLFYSQHLPSFLNKRAFMCLIRVLTRKHQNKEVVEKSLQIFKTLLNSSYDRDEEGLVIEGIPLMYQKLLVDHRDDALFLMEYHCLRSYKVRSLLKTSKALQMVKSLGEQQKYAQICKSILFTVNNSEGTLILQQTHESDDLFYQLLRKGLPCKLYRIDGSSKKAIIDIDEEYNLRAYKYPDGEIKKKYTINARHVKDFQFNYATNIEAWKFTPFNMSKGVFDSKKGNINCCCSIVGSAKWGDLSSINVQFDKEEDKNMFYRAFSNILFAFRH